MRSQLSYQSAVLRLFITQMQALHDIVQAGYVRYIGMSSCYAYQCKLFLLSFCMFTKDLCLVHAMQSL
jgi:aryl-alcohol dehydrogenase-like predicted oxidoreductase